METINLSLCSDADLELLAVLNKQLIEDEKHDNKMDIAQLKERMRVFINTDYHAYFFMRDEAVVGYALVDMKKQPLYLRQFFICREYRRKGYGTIAFNSLLQTLGTDAIGIDVLSVNERGRNFWKSLGFTERSIYMQYIKPSYSQKACKVEVNTEGSVIIKEEDPNSPDAVSLINALSEELESITGDSGRSSFNPNDVCTARGIFVMARNQDGKALGCGALRPMDENTAEVKRMYAKEKGVGVGKQILCFLEDKAYELGYTALRLETRLVNQRAVAFYEKNGYSRIPNYGKYIDRPEAVCFEKRLT